MCKRILLLYVFLVCVSLSIQAQLKGYVVDGNNAPLPGTSVFVVGTNVGAATNDKGYYEIKAHIEKGASIQYSFIGMKKRIIKYSGQSVQNVTLTEDKSLVLDNVVIKGTANVNDIDVRGKVGVVQHINIKRLEEKPMIDLGLALQGSVAGLTVMNTGDLGSAPKIRIRGNSSLRKGNSINEPLYVLDGQVISSEIFYNLNPSDIKEMKVLKDAAACALYGVKAANGVIEISSQRGGNGQISINYSGSYGLTLKGKRGIRMMDSSQKLELERLLQNPETPGYRYSEDYLRKYYASAPNLDEMIADGRNVLDSLRNINTDWFKELLHDNFYQKHNLSVKGGNEQTSYYFSANYTRQNGRIKGNDKDRMSMRLNLDQKLGNMGYLLLSLSGGGTNTRTPNGTSSDPTSLVYALNPYESKTGELYSYPGQTYNDLMHQYTATSTGKDASVSASVDLKPFEGLQIGAAVGCNVLLDETRQFTPSTAYSEMHSGIPEIERGIYSKNKNVTTNVSTNIRATYSKRFNDLHDLTLGVNSDCYYTDVDNVSMTGYGVGVVNSASAINQSLQGNRQPLVGGLREKTCMLGFGALASYTFNDCYDVYGTYKRDASSVLPADKRWNTAWAVGLGWTVSRYEFIKRLKFITNLNLKASYGFTANLNGSSISSTLASFSYSSTGYEGIRTLDLLELYNKDLKPEETENRDFGFNLQLFKKLDLNFNYYNRITRQALLDVPIPTSTGFSMLKRNIGVLKNEGIECSVNWQAIDTDDWRLSIGANFAYNSNKVLDLYYADKIYTSDDALVPDYEVGKSYDMLYGPQSLGINPFTGYPIFRLPDGTEKQATESLTKDDVVALGHTTPPYTGGMSFSFGYKQLEFDMDWYFVHGGILRYNYSYVRTKDNANKNAVDGQIEKMWFKSGDENRTYSTPFYTSSTAETNIVLYPNSRTVGKSDYLKLSMISLRYRVPSQWIRKNIPFVKYANVALQGSNLLTLTNYDESDPESGTLAGTMQPVYTLSLSVTF